MAKVTLSKSSLLHVNTQLKMYKQFLPSLDLKRQQLLGEQAKARRILEKTTNEIEAIRKTILRKLPMLSNRNVDLKELATVKRVQLDEENLMGVRLPTMKSVDVKIRDYSFMGKPHWVDTVAVRLKEMLVLRIRMQVEEQRLHLLNQAVQRITQRVNLFDKVLIPQAQADIKRIKIFLADTERAGVVRAKISKKKRMKVSVS